MSTGWQVETSYDCLSAEGCPRECEPLAAAATDADDNAGGGAVFERVKHLIMM